MVLGLPEVSLELEEDAPSALEVDLQPVVRGEERVVDAVLDPLRADQVRECPSSSPSGVRARYVAPFVSRHGWWTQSPMRLYASSPLA